MAPLQPGTRPPAGWIPVRLDVRFAYPAAQSWSSRLLWEEAADWEPGDQRRLEEGQIAEWLAIELGSTGLLVNTLLQVCSLADADFGCVHTLTAPEVAAGELIETVSACPEAPGARCLDLGVLYLEQFVPDLYWANFFGPPFLQHFGEDQILSTPCHSAARAGAGICLQLTAGALDPVREPDAFEAARSAAKAHLNRDSFFDPTLPAEHVYPAPRMRFDIPGSG